MKPSPSRTKYNRYYSMFPRSVIVISLIAAGVLTAPAQQSVAWKDAMKQPRDWYGSAEAVRVAGQLLLYQHDNGGWEKNLDMAAPLSDQQRGDLLARRKENLGHTTIDNDATYTQMRYLARVYTATRDPRYRTAFQTGLNYLLEAQYANGGWPQFYPLRDGYWSHITYNDDAMIGVMETLRSIVRQEPDFAFVADPDRVRATQAIEKGIQCILKTQVRVDGKLTAWCAQHDEKTLLPAKARAYEHPSLSGSESVGVVQFLMAIRDPSPEVTSAIKGAIAWFDAVRIKGIRLERKPVPGTPRGYDFVVVPDAAAPPLWARFYEIGTNRPIFSGRDSVVKYQLSEIEYERRTGYRWYVDRPAQLFQ